MRPSFDHSNVILHKSMEKYSIIMIPCFWTIVLTWQLNILWTLLNYGITIIHAHKSMLLPCSFYTVCTQLCKKSIRENPPISDCMCAPYIHTAQLYDSLLPRKAEEERKRARESERERERARERARERESERARASLWEKRKLVEVESFISTNVWCPFPAAVPHQKTAE